MGFSSSNATIRSASIIVLAAVAIGTGLYCITKEGTRRGKKAATPAEGQLDHIMDQPVTELLTEESVQMLAVDQVDDECFCAGGSSSASESVASNAVEESTKTLLEILDSAIEQELEPIVEPSIDDADQIIESVVELQQPVAVEEMQQQIQQPAELICSIIEPSIDAGLRPTVAQISLIEPEIASDKELWQDYEQHYASDYPTYYSDVPVLSNASYQGINVEAPAFIPSFNVAAPEFVPSDTSYMSSTNHRFPKRRNTSHSERQHLPNPTTLADFFPATLQPTKKASRNNSRYSSKQLDAIEE